jgi:hypothetical protein
VEAAMGEVELAQAEVEHDYQDFGEVVNSLKLKDY